MSLRFSVVRHCSMSKRVYGLLYLALLPFDLCGYPSPLPLIGSRGRTHVSFFFLFLIGGRYLHFCVVFRWWNVSTRVAVSLLWSVGRSVCRCAACAGERCGRQRFAVVQGGRQRHQVRPFPAYLEVRRHCIAHDCDCRLYHCCNNAMHSTALP